MEVVNIREGGVGCVGGGELPSSRGDTLIVSDGESTFTVDVRDMRTMVVPRAIVPRLQSQAGASAAPTRSAPPGLSKAGCWSWLSPSGLEEAEVQELLVPRRAIPHLVGKGGSTIRQIEELTGIIVGVADTAEGEAMVTLFGLALRVTAARLVIQCLARGGRSLLSRLREWGYLV